MKILFVAIAACLALAGCQTTAANVDQAVQKTLPAICQGAATAEPVLTLLIDGGKIKGNKAAAVQAAFASIKPMCVDPSKETGADVLVQATVAYLTISTALKSAQVQGN